MNSKNLLSWLARNPKAKMIDKRKVIGAGEGLFTKEGEYTITGLRYDSFDDMVKIKISHTGGSTTPLMYEFCIESLIHSGFINPEKLPINNLNP